MNGGMRLGLSIILGVLALILAFAAGAVRERKVARASVTPVHLGYTPMRTLRRGPERVAVFIGSSTCGAAEEPRIVNGLRDLWTRLAKDAQAQGMPFSTIGVALDWRASEGIAFLRELGWFDEVIAGRNWLNQGAYRFLFADLPGSPAMPQILLIERDVDPQQRTIQVLSERIIDRKVGVQEIVDWMSEAAPKK